MRKVHTPTVHTNEGARAVRRAVLRILRAALKTETTVEGRMAICRVRDKYDAYRQRADKKLGGVGRK